MAPREFLIEMAGIAAIVFTLAAPFFVAVIALY